MRWILDAEVFCSLLNLQEKANKSKKTDASQLKTVSNKLYKIFETSIIIHIFKTILLIFRVYGEINLPDWVTFSLMFIVPTFDTKVMEYLCSEWVFFLQTNFDFLTSHFWRIFKISSKTYCCPELKFEKIVHLWSFFKKSYGV